MVGRSGPACADRARLSAALGIRVSASPRQERRGTRARPAMTGFATRHHSRTSLPGLTRQSIRLAKSSWPYPTDARAKASGSDAVLRTAMPSHDGRMQFVRSLRGAEATKQSRIMYTKSLDCFACARNDAISQTLHGGSAHGFRSHPLNACAMADCASP